VATVTAPACSKRRAPGTCIEQLADGWCLPADLCPSCTQAFMAALDGIAGPMVWHQNYRDRARP
jgi:hypothetical protein